MCMAVEQRNSRQIVAQAGLKIVEVVGWCDLHRAGAEFPIHQNWVSHDWDSAVSQRQLDLLPDEAVVTWVFWVDGNAGVPQHGLRPRRRDGQMRSWILRQRIADVVELAGGVPVLDLDVGKRGQAARAPVDQTF